MTSQDSKASISSSPSDVEVRPKRRRRRFTAQYKLRVLEAVDACSQSGEVGALLRREGLYSSHLTDWRRQREQGALAALAKQRGRKPKSDADKALTQEVARLRREVERLEERLAKAKAIIDVQKKLSEILGLSSETSS